VLLRGACICTDDDPSFTQEWKANEVIDVKVKDDGDTVVERKGSQDGAESSNSVQLHSTPTLGSMSNDGIVEFDSDAAMNGCHAKNKMFDRITDEWRDDLPLIFDEFDSPSDWPSTDVPDEMEPGTGYHQSEERSFERADQSDGRSFGRTDESEERSFGRTDQSEERSFGRTDQSEATGHSFLFSSQPDDVLFTSWGLHDVYSLNIS